VFHKEIVDEKPVYVMNRDYTVNYGIDYIKPKQYLIWVKRFDNNKDYYIDSNKIYKKVKIGETITVRIKCFRNNYSTCFINDLIP